MIFISCKAPVDPVELVLRHIENVEQTGITHTRCGRSIQYIYFRHSFVRKENISWSDGFDDRYAHRLTPVSNTCVANVPEIKSLTQRVLKPFLLTQKDPDENYRVSRYSDLQILSTASDISGSANPFLSLIKFYNFVRSPVACKRSTRLSSKCAITTRYPVRRSSTPSSRAFRAGGPSTSKMQKILFSSRCSRWGPLF